MKVIVAGSRSIKSIQTVERAIAQSGFQITELIHGGASGVDASAALIGHRMRTIPVKEMAARWDDFALPKVIRKFTHDGREYNAAAGFLRNEHMAQYAKGGGLVAVWDFKSPGTVNMIANGIIYGLEVFVYDMRTNTGRHVPINGKTVAWAKDIIAHGYKKGNKYD